MRKRKVGAIAIKSFALLVVLGAAYQAVAQDATTPSTSSRLATTRKPRQVYSIMHNESYQRYFAKLPKRQDNVRDMWVQNGRSYRRPASRIETKIFDPRDPATGLGGAELLDASVVQRDDQWWLYLAGQAHGYGATDIYSASLAPGEPLAARGWRLTRGAAGKLVPVAGRSLSLAWDGNGGRHCPSYVKGWNPQTSQWVERIYYAGAAENLWGPYTIGFLEWDGEKWIDQLYPAFVPNEEWEHGSVYEPNLIYHDGKWKIWYVAGSNQEDYLVHGYAESEDGSTGWSNHTVFAPPEMKMFDFCVRQREDAFDAIFSRVWVKEGTPPSDTGLWWCRANKPSGKLSDWSEQIQIMTAADREWHAGPWKPSFQFHEQTGERALVFFDGSYRTSDPGPFPFAFTLGCLEIDLPLGSVSSDHQGA